MSLIAKRFEQDVQPYTAEEISEECQIPIRLTHETLYELQEINLLHEVVTDEKSEDIAYQPSMDINKMNVALLLDKLDTHGSEDFKIDKENEFNNQWGALLKARGGILQECKQGAAEGFVSTRKSFRKLRICFLFDYFLDADDADWNIKKIRVICVICV